MEQESKTKELTMKELIDLINSSGDGVIITVHLGEEVDNDDRKRCF